MLRCFAALAIATLLAGCEATRETQVREFCAHTCGCQFALPSVVEVCVDECIDDNAGASDERVECLACLTTIECSGDADACDAPCFFDPFTSRQEIR